MEFISRNDPSNYTEGRYTEIKFQKAVSYWGKKSTPVKRVKYGNDLLEADAQVDFDGRYVTYSVQVDGKRGPMVNMWTEYWTISGCGAEPGWRSDVPVPRPDAVQPSTLKRVSVFRENVTKVEN